MTTIEVYVVAAWNGQVSEAWYPWLKQQLKQRGDTNVTLLAGSNDFETSLEFLKRNVDVSSLNERTFFVGHSVGCQQVIRWLATLDENVKIGGVLLIAGWMDIQQEDRPTEKLRPDWMQGFITAHWDKLSPWISSPFDANRAKKIQVLISQNDAFTWKWEENKKKFEERIPGIEVIVRETGNHFTNKEEIEVLNLMEKFLNSL